MRYNVVMDATKPTSLRIPAEIISAADEIAKTIYVTSPVEGVF